MNCFSSKIKRSGNPATTNCESGNSGLWFSCPTLNSTEIIPACGFAPPKTGWAKSKNYGRTEFSRIDHSCHSILGASQVDLQRRSGGNRTDLLYNKLPPLQIDDFSQFGSSAVFPCCACKRRYCAAYPVDVFISASSYREQWFKYRWVIFLVGVLFAATITRFFALGMFQTGS